MGDWFYISDLLYKGKEFRTIGILTYVVASIIDKFFYKIPNNIYIVICIIAFVLVISSFILDRIKKGKYIRNYKKEKLSVLIIHRDEEERKKVEKWVDELWYTEIVGVAENGESALKIMKEKKPEMVFSEYNLQDMDGFELMIKSHEKVRQFMPLYNFFTDDLPEQVLVDIIHEFRGLKLNGYIDNPDRSHIRYVLKCYKDYVNKRILYDG